jgi:diguanylate cyclase (GGDEF)-like protein/PAS domain S-box-containing protein
MTAIIDKLEFEPSDGTLSDSLRLTFLDDVHLYSEHVDLEMRALRDNRDLLLTIINLIPVAFFVKDYQSRFLLMNRTCEEQWGMSFADLRDTDGSQFFPPEQMKQFLATDRSIFDGGKPVEFEEAYWSASHKSNRTGCTFKRPIYDKEGKPQYLVCITLDITTRKQAQAALVESEIKLLAMVSTDALTDLPNRRHFLARMTDEFDRVRRSGTQSSSVLMLDLDYFKRLNDTHGHAGGDAALKHFADVVRDTIRTIDSPARMGGEEFAILLPGADIAAARSVAERLREKLMKTPLILGGSLVPMTVSIGIAMMDPRDANADAGLIRADEALYRAKGKGRNCVDFEDFALAQIH